MLPSVKPEACEGAVEISSRRGARLVLIATPRQHEHEHEDLTTSVPGFEQSGIPYHEYLLLIPLAALVRL